MMDGLIAKKYLHVSRKRFDPFSLLAASAGLIDIVYALGGLDMADSLWEPRGFAVVVGGTFASLLFQFDFLTCLRSFALVLRSFLGTPEKSLLAVCRQLDEAIVNNRFLTELRDGEELTGEILNDVVYMVHQNLYFEEVDEFLTSRVKDEFFGRATAAQVLNKATVIAPALGLFGTVVGLIGLLRGLDNPATIGPAMSLALLTTAYGAGLGSLVFSPLAGRMDHHNAVHLELHKQILSKVAILLHRAERSLESPAFDPMAGAS